MDDDAEVEKLARTMHADGATIGQVLRHFGSKLDAMRVLMRLAPVGLIEARSMAMAFDDGEMTFDHMRLADLEYLARVIAISRHPLVGSHLVDAIQRGHRRLWFARGHDMHWRTRVSANETDVVCQTSSTLEELRKEMVEPRWQEHVRVVRDEPDLVVLEFPLVTAAG